MATATAETDLTFCVHHWEKAGAGLEGVVTSITPLMILRSENETLYLQHGRVWTGPGEWIQDEDKMPSWLWEQLLKCTVKGVDETGCFPLWTRAFERAGQPVPKLEAKQYPTCPKCGKMVTARDFSEHLLEHLEALESRLAESNDKKAVLKG